MYCLHRHCTAAGLGSGDEHMGLAAEAAPPAAATAAPGTGQAHTAEEEAELLALLDAEEEHYREMEQQYAAQQAQHAAAPGAHQQCLLMHAHICSCSALEWALTFCLAWPNNQHVPCCSCGGPSSSRGPSGGGGG